MSQNPDETASRPAEDPLAEGQETHEFTGAPAHDVDASTQDEEVEVIRVEIEQTRADMTETIDAIQDKLSPEHIAEQAREAAIGRAQGAVDDAAERARQARATAVSTVKENRRALLSLISPLISSVFLLAILMRRKNAQEPAVELPPPPPSRRFPFGRGAPQPPPPQPAQLLERVRGAADQGQTKVKQASSQVSDKFKQASDQASKKAQKVGDRASSKVKEAGDESTGKARKFGGRSSSKAKEATSQASGKAAKFGSRLTSKVTDTSKEATSKAAEASKQAVSKTRDAAEQAKKKARDAAGASDTAAEQAGNSVLRFARRRQAQAPIPPSQTEQVVSALQENRATIAAALLALGLIIAARLVDSKRWSAS